MRTSPAARVLPVATAGVGAIALVPAEADDVFVFLADLKNHWRLADRFVDVVELAGPLGARNGGRVRIRAPLGLRRTAVTRVVEAIEPRWLRGKAEVGGTTAEVRWILAPVHDATEVRLEATVLNSRPLDRMLLALGSR
jgi:hypothetical protein